MNGYPPKPRGWSPVRTFVMKMLELFTEMCSVLCLFAGSHRRNSRLSAWKLAPFDEVFFHLLSNCCYILKTPKTPVRFSDETKMKMAPSVSFPPRDSSNPPFCISDFCKYVCSVSLHGNYSEFLTMKTGTNDWLLGGMQTRIPSSLMVTLLWLLV